VEKRTQSDGDATASRCDGHGYGQEGAGICQIGQTFGWPTKNKTVTHAALPHITGGSRPLDRFTMPDRVVCYALHFHNTHLGSETPETFSTPNRAGATLAHPQPYGKKAGRSFLAFHPLVCQQHSTSVLRSTLPLSQIHPTLAPSPSSCFFLLTIVSSPPLVWHFTPLPSWSFFPLPFHLLRGHRTTLAHPSSPALF